MEKVEIKKTPVLKRIVSNIWRKDKFIIGVLVVCLAILLLSNQYGYRICNCTTTEKWEPGTVRSAHGGVNHFYHK